GIWRPDRGGDRLAGQDHHVPDLFQDVLRRQKRAIGDCSNQIFSVLPGYVLPRRRLTSLSLRERHSENQVGTVAAACARTAAPGWARTRRSRLRREPAYRHNREWYVPIRFERAENQE